MDYRKSLAAILGDTRNVFPESDAWSRLERELGIQFPVDYKCIVDAYAPVQLNYHLYLDHPANQFRPLGGWITRVIESLGSVSWSDDMKCPGFESGPSFGGKSGMIPITSTDRGEYAFLAPGRDDGCGRILTWGRDAPAFYEHDMSFSEWLYRYLAGEAMFVPGTTAWYPGPLFMESLPARAGDRTVEWNGPSRGSSPSGGS